MAKRTKKEAAIQDPLDRDPLYQTKLQDLKPYLKKKDVTEVILNRPGEVILMFADGSKKFIDDPKMTMGNLTTFAEIIATRSFQQFNRNKPTLSAKLSGGHRLQVVAYDSVSSGFCFSIRINRNVTYTMDDFNIPKEDQKTILKNLQNKTLLVSGGTGTGKTSLLNALIPKIPENDRIVTIEGVAELKIPHKDWCSLLYSENNSSMSGRGAHDLLRDSMRLRPDRIILGEIHNENALTFANAINSGHEGSLATIHANSPKGALVALIAKMIVAGDLPSGSIDMMRNQLCTDIEGIVQIRRDNKTQKRIAEYQPMSAFIDSTLVKDVELQVEEEKKNEILS